MDDTVKKILWILVGLGILWFITGGVSRMEKNGLFLTPPTLTEKSEVYGEIPSFWDFLKKPSVNLSTTPEEKIQSEIKKAQEEAEQIEYDLEKIKEAERTSIYKDKIEISRNYGSRSDVDEEYIKLRVNNLNGEKIQISDWKLRSAVTGVEVYLGNATKIPYTSRENYKQAIFVEGGEDIIVVTGRSPIGFSFQVNKCSGYLEQFQDFQPGLSKNCPRVEDENLPVSGPNSFNDGCWNFIDSISKCETPLEYPLDLQSECRSYLVTNVNHNACLDNHRNDSDFFKPEWRLFLGKSTELWKKDREIIELIDSEGKIVDSYSY
ncbi:hypothetical protein KKH36_02915 [Patescibacteria group bacterium]|nr:hypothetical protein [Patescibacteria group bacterium]